jgi:hypothetical protein
MRVEERARQHRKNGFAQLQMLTNGSGARKPYRHLYASQTRVILSEAVLRAAKAAQSKDPERLM